MYLNIRPNNDTHYMNMYDTYSQSIQHDEQRRPYEVVDHQQIRKQADDMHCEDWSVQWRGRCKERTSQHSLI